MQSKLLITLIVICFMPFLPVNSRAHMEPMPVIIDTDMALDDARALVLMLNSAHLQVLAVVSSDGGSSPEAGCANARRILGRVHKSEVISGRGKQLDAPAPSWRELTESAQKTGLADADVSAAAALIDDQQTCSGDAASVIAKILNQSDQSIGYVCLGPLTNLAAALRAAPSLQNRIKAVFYYGTPPDVPCPD